MNGRQSIEAPKKVAAIGFGIGASMPLLYGLYLVYSVASLPEPVPGEAHDGTPAVAGVVFICIVAPALGVLGICIAWIVNKVVLKH